MPSESEHILGIPLPVRATLHLAAEGRTNREIAAETAVSYETAKKRLQRFCEAHGFNELTVRAWARDHRECCLAIPQQNSGCPC